MNLSSLIEISAAARKRRFPGRSLAGRIYRTLLFSVIDGFFKLGYRLRLCLMEKSLAALSYSDYRLLKEVRSRFPCPDLCRQWVRGISQGYHPARYTDLIAKIHETKQRAPKVPWILPETALLAPDLDCKGFAVLLSAACNARGIGNELWIGLPADGQDGHAWVVIHRGGERIAVDQFNGNGTDETLFLVHHSYSMSFKV